MYKILCAIVFPISLIFCTVVLAQNSFEVLVSTSANEYFDYTFEGYNNCYISLGGRNPQYGADEHHGLVITYDTYGNLLQEKEIIKADTFLILYFGIKKLNGNYLVFGTLSDSITTQKQDFTYICEISPELNILWEKKYPLTYDNIYSHHYIHNFLIDDDSCLIISGTIDTSQYNNDRLLFLMKYDINGNELGISQYYKWQDYYGQGSDLIFSVNNTNFYLIGDLVYNSIPYDWIEFNPELNIVGFGEVEDSLGYMGAPLSVAWIPENKMVLANNVISDSAYHDLEMRIVDQNFNLIYDTIIYHDENVFIPSKKGLMLSESGNLWTATSSTIPTNFPGTDVFRIFIFDSCMHLRGFKVFGGITRYWFFNLLTTNDNGCLLTGMVPDYEGAENHDGYIIKVMMEDILTNVYKLMENNSKYVSVYPNPFSSMLNFESINDDIIFELYQNSGKLVISTLIRRGDRMNISTKNLSAGSYYFQIKFNNCLIQDGVLIKI